MMVDERRLVILYGSQTGTAEEVAESLSRDAIRRHMSVELSALDEFDVKKLLTADTVLFVCSTTGQGDPPDNMHKFWRFIMRKNLPSNSLGHMKYVVIGLGDSSYQKYNFVAKKLNKRLQLLSARQLMSPILADEQHEVGSDAALDLHLPELWKHVLSLHPLPPNKSIVPDTEILPSKYIISTNGLYYEKTTLANLTVKAKVSADSPFSASLISNERITADSHFQDVRLVRLDITGSGIRYQPGDVAYIRPENSSESVQEFLTLLNLKPDEPIRIQCRLKEKQLPVRLQGICTWRSLATHYLDICSVPRKYFLQLLSQFTRDEQEREKLQEFCTAEGQDERFAYCNRVRRTYLEVLSDFRHATPYIPADYILDMIPALQPRAFSISSAQQDDSAEDILEILMAVVKYKTKLVTPRVGVCSNWIASLDPTHNSSLPVWVQRGSMRFPANGEACIMIGPGTGVAPFRSFILHRARRKQTANILFFGCRSRQADFLCQKDWLDLIATNSLELHTAFSRDQDEKYYVWNAMLDVSAKLWSLLEDQHAYVFVAGNAKRMPDDVRGTLVRIVGQEGKMSAEAAEEYIYKLEQSGRYQLECWS